MTHRKTFLLKNLLKLRDQFWEVDNETLDNVIEYFRDELQLRFDLDETYATYEGQRRIEAFEQYCADTILAINN